MKVALAFSNSTLLLAVADVQQLQAGAQHMQANIQQTQADVQQMQAALQQVQAPVAAQVQQEVQQRLPQQLQQALQPMFLQFQQQLQQQLQQQIQQSQQQLQRKLEAIIFNQNARRRNRRSHFVLPLRKEHEGHPAVVPGHAQPAANAPAVQGTVWSNFCLVMPARSCLIAWWAQ